MRSFRKLIQNQRGATAIEYALVASFISIAAVMSFDHMGEVVDNRYQAVEQKL